MASLMLLSAPFSSTGRRFESTGSFAKPTGRKTKVTSIRSSGSKQGTNQLVLDRRNVLLGLGGLYGAANLSGLDRAVAAPVEAPDLTACHTATYPDGFNDETPTYCCPPYSTTTISPYVFPQYTTFRTRRPAHRLTQWEIDRFESAISIMKSLPSSDPWSFTQQARIHCAYCNGAYNQSGYEDVLLQVHFSWLFLPWHRFYLYFFERILGKLVEDETFALPFWNYDLRGGMYIPPIYLDTSSTLYDENRNSAHFTQMLDLTYSPAKEEVEPDYNVPDVNIAAIRSMFCETLEQPELFMGGAVRAGETPSMSTTMGECESVHNVPHMWVGNIEAPNTDMGNFYSAARDMLFWAHHSNVDRFWHIYHTLRAGRVEFDDTDWLDATFVFYDENREIVSVKVRDSLQIARLGYVFEYLQVEYLPCTGVTTIPSSDTTTYTTTDFGSAQTLSNTLNLSVTRPQASAPSSNQTEVLVISGIEVLDPAHARFDIFINTLNDDGTITGLGCLAGLFARVRHVSTNPDGSTSSISRKLGITKLLASIGAQNAKKIGVSLVPLDGSVRIGNVSIELVDNN